MNISGIRPYNGIYNGYERVQSVNPQAEEVSSDLASRAAVGTEVHTEEAPAGKQTFGAYDLAQQYDPKASYELKGADSDLRSLDVEKAINTMEKDSALQQYQRFVGPDLAGTPVNDLHPVENFNF